MRPPRRHAGRSEESWFTWLIEQGEQGEPCEGEHHGAWHTQQPFDDCVIDTGCAKSIVGQDTLHKLNEKIQKDSHGLLQVHFKEAERLESFKGVGGVVKAIGEAIIPLEISKRLTLVSAQIIPGVAPFLLSLSALNKLGVLLELSGMKLWIPGSSEWLDVGRWRPSGTAYMAIKTGSFSKEVLKNVEQFPHDCHGTAALFSSEKVEDTSKPRATAQSATPPTQAWTDNAIYCEKCEVWLNGKEQWERHLKAKKHNKPNKLSKSFKYSSIAEESSHDLETESHGSDSDSWIKVTPPSEEPVLTRDLLRRITLDRASICSENGSF